MMKKLLVLSLVLGMAAMASAGLVLNNDGEMTAYIDGVEGNGFYGQVCFVSIIGTTTDSTFTFQYTGGAKAVTDYTGVDPDLTAGIEFYAGAPVNKIYFVEFTDTTELAPSTEGRLGTWLLNAGDVITLHDADDLSVLGSYTATPEPMTMALLGLGGLFLRRRK